IGVHEGTMVSYHQTQADREYQDYIDGIEMLQYDILYGERYCYENGVTPYPPTKIVMGVDRVYINDMYLSKEVKNRVVIKGSGFTQWSRVFVNGEKVGTEYVSDTEIMISTTRVKSGDEIIVKQLGAKSSVFSSSNSWFYVANTKPVDITTPPETPVNASGKASN
ncbi:MAG: LTA synthase family protein, partial [Agathobacter sp.]|nr:LTA synthase family protein [Agathobacter sp.]